MGEKKVKISHICDCPHCGKSIMVEAGDEIMEPSTPAVKEPFFEVRKDTQKKLDK